MAIQTPIPQSEISGVLLATARGTFMYDDKGKAYYNFIDSDAFKWKLPETEIETMEIDFQDLYDCCEQAVKEFGDPEEYRVKMGLEPNSGYSNLGLTFRSKTDERIMCVFTPTSNEGGEWDSYFEWYFQEKPHQHGEETVSDFFERFEKMAGLDKPKDSIVVAPGYGEACEYLNKQGILSEEQEFLSRLHKFHNTTSRGYKLRLEQEIIQEWKGIQRKALLTEDEGDSKLHKLAKYIGNKFNGEVPELADEARVACALNSSTGIPFDCELEILEDGKLKYSLRKDDEIVDEFEFEGLNKSNGLALIKMISDQLFVADALNGQTEGRMSNAFRFASKLIGKGKTLTEAVDASCVRFSLDNETGDEIERLCEAVKSKKKNQSVKPQFHKML